VFLKLPECIFPRLVPPILIRLCRVSSGTVLKTALDMSMVNLLPRAKWITILLSMTSVFIGMVEKKKMIPKTIAAIEI